MRKMSAPIGAIIYIICVVLAACGNPADGNDALGQPVGGKVDFAISFSDKARAVYPPDNAMKARMEYTLSMTGGGATLTFTATGTEIIRGRAKPASYQATLTCVLDGALYAKGTHTLNVKAGAENFFPFVLNNAQVAPPAPVLVTALTPVLTGLPTDTQYIELNDTTATLDVSVLNDDYIIPQHALPGTGTGSLSCQWYESPSAALPNPPASGTPLAAGFSYSLPTATTGTNYYYVIVTNVIPDNGDGGLKTATRASPVVTVEVQTQADYWNTIDFGPGAAVIPHDVYSPSDLETFLTGIMNTAGNYAITVNNLQTIYGGSSATVTLGNGVNVSLRGSATITKASGTGDNVWAVGNGAKLVLRGVTLNGSGKPNPLVVVETGGTLVMESGTITNAGNSIVDGGGVSVGGTFIMNGGAISNNTTSYGGGVYIRSGGVFTMTGGDIHTNTSGSGGGVFIRDDGVFTMTGGTITNNFASASGGGVYISSGSYIIGVGGTSNGIFNLNSPAVAGSINSNNPDNVRNGGTFMVDGVITSSY